MLPVTAQHAVEAAIAAGSMAASERSRRAKVELIPDAAVIRAEGTAAPSVETAMIAVARRQLRRVLPVDANKVGRRDGDGGYAAMRGQPEGKGNRRHDASVMTSA